MENKIWIKLDNDSTGSLKRFHKLIRLFVYYHYKSEFSFGNKTKSRYYAAKTGIESLMKKHIRKNYIGYSKWEAELLGSRSIPDMKCNINQKYLITLSSSEYTKNKFRVIPFDSNFEYYVVQILTESGWENVTSAFVATDRLDLNCRNQPLLIKSFELACDKANWLAIDNNYLTYIEEQDKIYHDKVNELSSRNRENNMNEVIVCAAVRSSKTQQVVWGVRHGDETMFTDDDLDIYVEMFDEQGFMTNKRRFVDRQEAWVIANRENQIIKLVGGNNVDGGTLFSENLY